MLSDERILLLMDQCKTEAHTPTERGEWAKTVAPEYRTVGNYTTVKFARAIEREATAEATRIMREFVDANESKSLVRYVAAERAMLDYLERMK